MQQVSSGSGELAFRRARASIEFDDLAGLQAYLRHPAHEELGTRFGEITSGADAQGQPLALPALAGSSLVFDFEAGGVEGLETLI